MSELPEVKRFYASTNGVDLHKVVMEADYESLRQQLAEKKMDVARLSFTLAFYSGFATSNKSLRRRLEVTEKDKQQLAGYLDASQRDYRQAIYALEQNETKYSAMEQRLEDLDADIVLLKQENIGFQIAVDLQTENNELKQRLEAAEKDAAKQETEITRLCGLNEAQEQIIDSYLRDVESIFDVIKHGDEMHQKWLKETINAHFKLN